MSRRWKRETHQHRKERNRRRLRAAKKRRAASKWRCVWAQSVYAWAASHRRRVRGWHYVPRSWERRLRLGIPLALAAVAIVLAGCSEPAVDWRTEADQTLSAHRCETQEQRDLAFSEAEWCSEHADMQGLWCYAMAVRRNCAPLTKENGTP